jgi:hypothetical protein
MGILNPVGTPDGDGHTGGMAVWVEDRQPGNRASGDDGAVRIVSFAM